MGTHSPALKKYRGRLGEWAAAVWLLCKGYGLKARNVRFTGGELDLVVCKQDTLVFVEVKYRSSARFGRADEFVDAHKQRRLKRAALAYMHRQGINPEHIRWRFDVVAIQGWRLKHIQHAFD